MKWLRHLDRAISKSTAKADFEFIVNELNAATFLVFWLAIALSGAFPRSLVMLLLKGDVACEIFATKVVYQAPSGLIVSRPFVGFPKSG